MSDFVIESGVDIPEVQHAGGAGRPEKYPFSKLEVGQSFLVTDPPKRFAATASARARELGVKFATRKVDGGIRVWRVAEPEAAVSEPTEPTE